MLEGTDASTRIVRRSDVAAVAARRKIYDDAYNQFMASSPISALKRDFAAYLAAMKTVAGIHRYLQANGLESYAIGTFRKGWQGGAEWAAAHVGPWNTSKIAGLLGQDPTKFVAAVAEIDRMKAAIGGVPTVMGRITELQIPERP
jgi:hypothetical protein